MSAPFVADHFDEADERLTVDVTDNLVYIETASFPETILHAFTSAGARAVASSLIAAAQHIEDRA